MFNYSEVSDERRNLLRSVELKAVEYQDELEAGQRQVKAGWTVQQQVQHYRRKLIKKVCFMFLINFLI